MKKICSIIKVNLKNNLQSLSLVCVNLGISLICSVVIGVIGIQIINPLIKAGRMNSEHFSYILGILAYSTTLIVAGINFSTLFATPLTREKIRGNIECLLASGTDAKKLWLAKSIALFIPGLISGIVFSIGIIISEEVIFAAHGYKLILSTGIVVSTYIAVPAAYFGVSLLVNLVGLIGRVADAVPIPIIFVAGVPAVMIRIAVNASTSIFLILNLAIAVIMIALSFIFQSKLNTEGTVLACRK